MARSSAWEPPIVSTVALRDEGLEDLYQAVLDHRQFLLQRDASELKRLERNRIRNQLLDLLKEGLIEAALKRIGGIEGLEEMVEKIVDKQKDPYVASEDLVQELLRKDT